MPPRPPLPIDGHRADRKGAGLDNGPADVSNVAACGEIHDGIRSGLDAHGDLLDFYSFVRPVFGCADIGVDLGPEALADGQGGRRPVAGVVDHYDGPCGDALTDRFGRYTFRLGASLHLIRYMAPDGLFQLCHGPHSFSS
jgi:hypothetical protein